MAKGYVPEAAPVQDFWSKVIEPGNEPIVFRVGRDITVLRSGVPRSAKDVKEGVCCVYFVKGAWHFLAMVSEKNLMKVEATLGTGRDRTPATNHAKTLSWGMEAAAKKTRMAKFRKVDACFGFWFDVDKKDGVVYKFRSCANYFNAGHSTRRLAKTEETRLMAALATVSAIPRERQTDSDACDGKQLVGKYIAFAAEGGDHECRVIGFSGGKHTVRYDDGTQRKHVLKDKEWWCEIAAPASSTFTQKRKEPEPWGQKISGVTEYWDPEPSGDKKRKTPQCQGIVKTTGVRCRVLLSEWEWEDPNYCGRHQRQANCLARVEAHGRQCDNKHKAGSRWCGVHFNAWRGKESPKW